MKNVGRDYLRWIASVGKNLQLKHIDLPVKYFDKHGTTTVKQAVLPPHTVFATAYDVLPERGFQEVFLGKPGDIQEFWEKQKEQKWVVEHPGFRQERPLPVDKAVPLYVHCDWGQHINEDKVLVMSWGSSLSWAPVCLALFLFTLLPYNIMIANVSDIILHRVLNWSFAALSKGEHPWTDWDGSDFVENSKEWIMRGKRLAGDFSGLFSHYCSDWEWSLSAFKWRGYRHNYICHRDFACKLPGHLCFTDWRKEAGWRKTNYTHEDYMAETAALPEAAKITGWRLERTRADTMHAVNIGVCLYFIACILYELAYFRAYLLLGPSGSI